MVSNYEECNQMIEVCHKDQMPYSWLIIGDPTKVLYPRKIGWDKLRDIGYGHSVQKVKPI